MSKQTVISVRGARVHNLKNVSVDIPKNAMTVVTGLSGSGKSSLAFDTIYAEGQRRYAESLSSYARQFMGVGDKPDIDDIVGLSPTIAIDQKNISQNPRSTVGTSTEIYDLLRLLFARVGVQYDPATNTPVRVYSVGDIVERIRTQTKKHGTVKIFSPIIFRTKTNLANTISKLEHMQAEVVRINGTEMKLGDVRRFTFEPKQTYTVEMLIAASTADAKKQNNLVDVVNKAIDLSNGFVVLTTDTHHEELLSTVPFSLESQRLFEPLESRSFSFNSPHGACQRCTGLGYTMEVDRDLIIPNPRLTLAEGAIQPWMRIVGNQSFYQKLLTEVASAHKFSMDIPVEKLSNAAMQIIFYGTDGQLYEVDGKQVHFEGVVQNLLLRYNETDSDYVKKEIEEYMREARCSVCNGRRLKTDSLAVRIGEHNIADIAEKTIEEAYEYFDTLLKSVTKPAKQTEPIIGASQTPIVVPICKEILKRLETLTRVGLSYLTLDRSVTTISGGEAQRIRLSTQLSSGLSDVVYILDEPSIGLHPKDTEELIDTLRALQKNGNTVIVVEHDNAMIEAADYVIDMGPGAGTRGGEVMAVGTPEQIKKNKKSLTGQYLANKEEIETPKKYRKGSGKFLTIKGAKEFNLKNVDVSLPLGTLLCVTGVSGSGKSTLISDVLSKALHKQLYRAKAEPGAHETIEGTNNIDKVITIDQKPIGRTPRSNPATYTGVFTAIRDLFTEVPEAKMRGLNAGMFSFNVKGGGRCEACAGDGSIRIPMQFLSDVYMECGECNGKRYTREALEVKLKDKTIADVLAMTIEDAVRFFSDVPTIREKLSVLQDVGLGYIQLGQSATTLSGGEAQRIKLATELSRRQTGKTLYILDEPTTGLHFDDIKRLLLVLNKLVDKGNTVLMIEHNIDVVKCSDWVVDMGPGGGKHGGLVVAEGTPKDVAKVKGSATAKYLKEVF